MNLPTAVRRSLAVVASTALLTSGATGLFTGSAFAANSATVTGVSPSATNNSGNTAVTVTGSNFTPKPPAPKTQADTMTFAFNGSTAYVAPATAPPLTFRPDTQQGTYSSTSYSGTLGTSNAAPGFYDVYDVNSDGAGPKCVKCLFIGSSGAPDVTNITPGADTSDLFNAQLSNQRGPNAIDIFGRNLARASFVNLTLPNGQPDTAAAIKVGDANDTGDYSGYESASVIRAEYSENSNFNASTAGKRLVTVENTAEDPVTGAAAHQTGAAGELWLPFFKGADVSPTTFGQGVSDRVITIHGAGIRQGSQIAIQDLSDPNDPSPSAPTSPDHHVGLASVSADGTTITAPVSFEADAPTGTLRSVSIVGPDGGHYSVGSVVSVTPAPKISGFSRKLGQGGSVQVTVGGTGFAAGATPATVPTFTVSGTGITAVTKSSTNLQAVVQLTATSDAPTGARTIRVSNPDGGTSTYTG
ncbi:MAG: IPT/TIG domain-containing protein, partial [Mycobacteriales bacterium]